VGLLFGSGQWHPSGLYGWRSKNNLVLWCFNVFNDGRILLAANLLHKIEKESEKLAKTTNEAGEIRMHIKSVSTWDVALWQDAFPLYVEAFGDKGAKPVQIIQNMFAQEIAELHVAYNESAAVGMALTGKLAKDRVLIIDYLAISKNVRNQGLGKRFVESLRQKASDEGYRQVIIETESEDTPDNKKRIRFWQSCGFVLTEYVYQYIWVPEPYQAMYLPLSSKPSKTTGEELFELINAFHRLSFRKIGKEER
jgi:GNAT superfamily N-acetyltransferase